MSLHLKEESVTFTSLHSIYIYLSISPAFRLCFTVEYLNLSKRGRVWIPQLFAVGLSPLFNIMFPSPPSVVHFVFAQRTIKQQK